MRRRIYDILEGETGLSVLYGRIMTLFIVASLVPLCFWEDNFIFDIIEYVCVTVFIVDYLARWVTSDYKLGKGVASFAIYPFTPMAIIDLVTILPTFLALNPAWRALRVLRLIRALRAFRLIRYSKSVNAIVNAFMSKRSHLVVVFLFAVAYVLIVAMVMFNVEHETFPHFDEAVYWSVVSLTTVGYGDLYPTSDIGRFVAMISAFVGIGIVALPASILTAGMMEEMEKEKNNDKEKGDSRSIVQPEPSTGDNAGETEGISCDGHSSNEEG